MRKIDKLLQQAKANTPGGDLAFTLGMVMPKGDKLEAVASLWSNGKKDMKQERAEFDTKEDAERYLEEIEAKYPPYPGEDGRIISIVFDDVKE